MDVPTTPFLTRPQLGERLHLSPRTLAVWAVRGEGPEYRVIGGRVLYRLADVEAWEAEQWSDHARRPARGRKPAASKTGKASG
ncbi:MAG: helix-turn-helix domain-containing protein [Mycobacterium sp.]